MTSPPEDVTLVCPECGLQYKDWWRPSVNLDLDDFDEKYLEECSSAVCPSCGHKVYFDSLVVRNGVFHLGHEASAGENDETTEDGETQRPSRVRPSVVVAPLQEVHAVSADEVHDAVLLVQAARPETWSEVFERLGFADP